MNRFLGSEDIESRRVLALGLEIVDYVTGARVTHPVKVVIERPALGAAKLLADRHDSCLHTLVFVQGRGDERPPKERALDLVEADAALRAIAIADATGPGQLALPRRVPVKVPPNEMVDIRIVEPEARYVPRRLRVPIMTVSLDTRTRQPVLFPGPNYDLSPAATALRGRVVRDGKPARWARIEVTLPGSETVIARAQGDHRGEFLAVIGSAGLPPGDLEDPLSVRLRVWGPQKKPVPDPAISDPLWDLPVEQVPPHPPRDRVSAGERRPVNYLLSIERTVSIALGRTTSVVDKEPFVLD